MTEIGGGNAKSMFTALSSVLLSAYTSEISGRNSIAVGGFALGNNSIAIGQLNRSGKYPDKAFATGESSIALGNLAKSTGRGATALGSGLASGTYSVAVAGGTASGECAVAFGSNASGERSLASGVSNTASGIASTAFGRTCTASGDHSFAAGQNAAASGAGAFAFGFNAKASGKNAIALGMGTIASGDQSMALGYSSEAVGANSTAIGYDAYAKGRVSQALGYGAYTAGDMSHSDGYYASTCLSTEILSISSITINDGDIVQWTEDGWKFVADKTHAHDPEYWADISATNVIFAYEACKMSNNDYSFMTGNRPVVGKYYQIKPDGGAEKATLYWAFFKENTTKCDLAWCWNGDISRVNSRSGRMYNAHGNGTFNINPVGGLSGVYIGEQDLYHTVKPLAGVKWSKDKDTREMVMEIAKKLGVDFID